VSILIDKSTRLIVQGITGRDGGFHTQQMIAYGTRVVAGVTPGKGAARRTARPGLRQRRGGGARDPGQRQRHLRARARRADAIYEAADAGIALIVCITEGLPVRDTNRRLPSRRRPAARRRGTPPRGSWGPTARGSSAPALEGRHPARSHLQARPGGPGVAQRHPDLRGGSPAHARRTRTIDLPGDRRRPGHRHQLHRRPGDFEADPQTEAIVLIGEIGGSDEEAAATFVKRHVRKPVVAFVAGQTAPPGKRMGHAGAIISGGSGTRSRRWPPSRPPGPVALIPSEIPR